MLRRIHRPKRAEVTESWRTVRASCIHFAEYLDYQVKEGEMGRHVVSMKYVRNTHKIVFKGPEGKRPHE
jgi:hypothetical protein